MTYRLRARVRPSPKGSREMAAFVDLGVHQDGLVHISELSHHYVADARRAVQVGEVVKVKVISVDTTLKRISLSVKATRPKPRPQPRPKAKAAPLRAKQSEGDGKPKVRKPKTKEAVVVVKKRRPAPAAPQLSMEEKIRRLQEKFRGPGR